EEAAGTGEHEGLYARGRVLEVTGKLEAALTDYRAALEKHPQADASGSRYRMAVARVRLKATEQRPTEPRPTLPLPAERASKLDSVPGGPEALLVLMTLTLQPAGGQGLDPALQEAIRLADEVLASKDAPFDAKAQALAIKGQYTEAIRTYAQGLKPKL